MITNQTIDNYIEEISSVSKTDFVVYDAPGSIVATTNNSLSIDIDILDSFFQSDAISREFSDYVLIKVFDDNETAYVLAAKGGADPVLVSKLVSTSLKNLIVAYKERLDRNSFFQNLILDNMLLVDVYNRAKKLHIDNSIPRCVFVIEPDGKRETGMLEMVKELFYTQSGDFVTAVDEQHIVVIKALDSEEDADTVEETARMLVDMAGSEAMQSVRVAYGTVACDLKNISKSYKEAMMALDVGKIFYIAKPIIAYNSLGIGRLIYQLPVNLCQIFVKEIFGDDIPTEIDDEMLTTVNKFFENSLNVSETSRQLCMHRNTLLYRIEKLQKLTGLDIRVFDDALTLKIALMVVNYIRFFEEQS